VEGIQQEWEQALDASGMGAWNLDLETGKIWRSARHDEIFGYKESLGEWTLDLFRKHVAEVDRERARKAREESYLTGHLNIECQIVRGDGSPGWISLRGKVSFDDQGKPLRLLGTVEDITAKKRAIEQLRESEERFRQLAENVQGVFWMRSIKGQTIYVSPSYEAIWGRSRQSLYDNSGSWIDAVVEEDRPKIRRKHESHEAAQSSDEEYRIARPDGSIRWIRDRSFAIRDARGEIYRYGGIAEDVTERKQLADQSLRAQRLESIGILAGGIAHDLNNILAPLLMGCDLLVTTSDQQKQLVDAMRASTKRGAALVEQVLSFARGVEGQRMDLDPRHLIKEVGKIVQTTFPQHIKLQTNVPSILWTLNADPAQLHQVLMNLAVNARDAMPNGGVLSLAASNVELDSAFASKNLEARPGYYVVITVADNGAGIPAGIREKIFDPFFTTKELEKGTGLGLSATLGIVKSYGGFITVDCEPGAGTSFKVYLPAHTGRPVSSVTEDVATLPKGHGELILVVDDEASLIAITRGTLESNGYRVLSSENGASAIVQYVQKQKEIALVLTDVMMPVMDGVSTIYALLQINPEVKIIAASGLGAETQVAACVTAGAKYFLHKPYSTTMLLTTLDQVLHPKA
jgi:PAS domain S-box-containing protein